MDGNGRMGRFLMNLMMASGGYPWTIVPLERCRSYMSALESASVEGDIKLHWIAPTEKDSASASLEKRLWVSDEGDSANLLKTQNFKNPPTRLRTGRSGVRIPSGAPIGSRACLRG
jgi:hypothetical protein